MQRNQEKRKKKKEKSELAVILSAEKDLLLLAASLFKTLRKKVIDDILRLRGPQAPVAACDSLTETRRHGEFQYKIQSTK